jgi:hypothetical protein
MQSERQSNERNVAFSHACDMEGPLAGIRNFATALCMIAETLDDYEALVVQELAQQIRDRVPDVEKSHEFFFRLHHPDRERFEREGWPTSERTSERE